MKNGRIPIIPTILVIAAAAIMAALGVWQLGRSDEKAALIAQYGANQQLPTLRNFDAFPASESDTVARLDEQLFRTVEISCETPRDWKAVAGRNDKGQSGYVHMFICDTATTDDISLYATIGWARAPTQPEWAGGAVAGILSTAGNNYEVIASEPEAGLVPLAKPDPADLPNNHLAYAGQWFFFALTALGIYFLALRRRWQEGEGKRR